MIFGGKIRYKFIGVAFFGLFIFIYLEGGLSLVFGEGVLYFLFLFEIILLIFFMVKYGLNRYMYIGGIW